MKKPSILENEEKDGIFRINNAIQELGKDNHHMALSLSYYSQTQGLRSRLKILTHLAKLLFRLQSIGLVYGDLNLNNVFYKDNSAFLIDADNVCYESEKAMCVIFTPNYAALEISQTSKNSDTTNYNTMLSDTFSFFLKLPLLAKKLVKKQEDNIHINANGAKGEIDEKGYLANALKDYDETLVEAFMRDFKERYKIEKLYYLLDDNIKNFEFAKIKYKISLYFKDAKFYPKSVTLGLSFLFENKLNKLKKYDDRLRYNGVDLVVKENHKSKTFNHCGLVLERQKSDDSKKSLILQDSFIKEDLILENFFIKKALKNFKRALGLEKEGFILYKECLPKLSMEVIKDGRFKNFEIIKDKTILGDKETLEIKTPFIIPKGLESLALPLILNEEKIAYQGKITSKDFPLENDERYKLTLTYDTGTEFKYVLEFKPVNNDLKPIVIEWQRIDTRGVELPTPDPIKKPSIDELKNDFNPKRGKSSDLFEWALE